MGGLSLLAASENLAEPGAPPVSRFFARRDGGRLHALDWGGDGPPALFIHGGALSAHTWDLACPLLRTDYRCLAVDMRGHGDSDWADSYRIEDYADDVACVIRELGWRRPHLVGMSLGGVVAAHAALNAKDFSPASLTLVDVAPGVDYEASAAMRDFITTTGAENGVFSLIETARKLGARGSDAKLFYRYATLIRQNPDGSWRWKFDTREPPDFPHILTHIDILNDRAKEMTWPCLIVRGALSRILSNEAAAAFAAKCPNGAWRIVEKAGHSVQEDNPQELARALCKFWRDAL